MLAAVRADTISGNVACTCVEDISVAIEAASGFKNFRSIGYPLEGQR